jgi:hypothetical protein
MVATHRGLEWWLDARKGNETRLCVVIWDFDYGGNYHARWPMILKYWPVANTFSWRELRRMIQNYTNAILTRCYLGSEVAATDDIPWALHKLADYHAREAAYAAYKAEMTL